MPVGRGDRRRLGAFLQEDPAVETAHVEAPLPRVANTAQAEAPPRGRACPIPSMATTARALGLFGFEHGSHVTILSQIVPVNSGAKGCAEYNNIVSLGNLTSPCGTVGSFGAQQCSATQETFYVIPVDL